jgi:GWxTD domain-containing protein
MAYLYKTLCWVVCLFLGFLGQLFAQKPEVYFHQNFFKNTEGQVLVENTLFVKDSKWRKLSDAEVYIGVQVLNSKKEVVQQDQRILKANSLLPLSLETTYLPYRLNSVLGAGNYQLKILIRSKVNPDSLSEVLPFTVKSFDADTATLSSIQMLLRYDKASANAMWSKHGYDLELQPSLIAGKTSKFLHAFIEAYQGKKRQALLVRIGISKGESGLWLDYTTNRRFKPGETDVVVLKSIDITELPSGTYFLRSDILDTSGKVIETKKIEFTRINPSADKVETAELNTNHKISGTFVDSMPLADLKKYMVALQPIATNQEQHTINILVKTQNTKQMQDYLLEFWKKRDAKNPESAFNDYKELLTYAQQQYGVASMNVFNTDRGRVLLQYGKPNRQDNELTDPARVGIQNSNLINYEIWTYYHTERSNQNNVQFVFVQENQGNNNFRLVHSTAIGEVYAPSWRSQLQQRYTQGNNGFNIDR